MPRPLNQPPAAPLSQTVARLAHTTLEKLTGLSRERLAGMFQRMTLIREFEEQSAALYRSGRMRGVTHTYQGQEAVAVGAIWSLRPDDYISSTHRGHAHVLAKDADEKVPVRVCGKNVPIPYNLGLEAAVIPQTEDIVDAARRLVNGLPQSQGAER